MISFLKYMLSFFSSPIPRPHVCARPSIHLETKMVEDLSSAIGSSLTNIFLLTERSENENEMRVGFDQLNEIIWTLPRIAPLNLQKGFVFEAL